MQVREATVTAEMRDDYEQKLADQTAQAQRHAADAERLQRLLSEKEAELSKMAAQHSASLEQAREQTAQQTAAAKSGAATQLHKAHEEREAMRASYEEKIQALRLTHAADLQTLHDERDEEMHSILEMAAKHEKAAEEATQLLEETMEERDRLQQDGRRLRCSWRSD